MSSLSKKVGAVLAAIAAVVLMVSGCRQIDSPMSAAEGVDNIRLFRDRTVTLGPNYVEKVVRAENGGRVVLNRYLVIIPPHALKKDTKMSICALDPELVIADYGPDGLRFRKPVELGISYRDLDLEDVEEDDLTIYWYNPANKKWIDMDGKVDKNGQTVWIHVDHYSRYALSDHCY